MKEMADKKRIYENISFAVDGVQLREPSPSKDWQPFEVAKDLPLEYLGRTGGTLHKGAPPSRELILRLIQWFKDA
jgi:hypothetical protein